MATDYCNQCPETGTCVTEIDSFKYSLLFLARGFRLPNQGAVSFRQRTDREKKSHLTMSMSE